MHYLRIHAAFVGAAGVGALAGEEAVWAVAALAANKVQAATNVAARFLYMVFLYMAPSQEKLAVRSKNGKRRL